MLKRALQIKPGWAFALYAVLDTLCAAMGMGVPIFNILVGFPVGWFVALVITSRTRDAGEALWGVMQAAITTSAVTLVWMVVIWARFIPMLFDPQADLANFGIPMILFEPVPSFVGWLVLMMVISPFLQVLSTLFGSYVTLLVRLRAGIQHTA